MRGWISLVFEKVKTFRARKRLKKLKAQFADLWLDGRYGVDDIASKLNISYDEAWLLFDEFLG